LNFIQPEDFLASPRNFSIKNMEKGVVDVQASVIEVPLESQVRDGWTMLKMI
jgi:hypothetical protein